MVDLLNVQRMEVSGDTLIAAQMPVGMVTLKADLAKKPTRAAVEKALGAPLPAIRKITGGIAWMAPDELLIFTDTPDETIAALGQAVKAPHLAVNVSDTRAMFTLKGPHLRDLLAKGAPVDLAPEAFGEGDFRRTRLGQVAVAFWQSGADEFQLVCFTSLWEFVFDWLVNAAQKDNTPAFFDG